MRKTWTFAAIALALCTLLTGCEAAPPTEDRDGIPWSADWIPVGENVMGVEPDPSGELVLRENNSSLAASRMYYAAWSTGEAEAYTNEDGEEADLYDAQVYLLLAGEDSPEEAGETVEEWRGLAGERYENMSVGSGVYNGQEFVIASFTYAADTNPYANGAAAFGVFGNWALNVEVSCRDTFEGSAEDVLTAFLERCHYTA